MTELERRYAGLLRLYPAAYRRARGAEMLAVLMDSAPADRSRPEWREVRGLVLGALRVRAGAHGHRTAGQSWRVALRIAAVMLLIKAGGDAVWQVSFNPVAVRLAVAAACVVAMVAVFRGAYLAATVVTTGAFVLDAFSSDHRQPFGLAVAVAARGGAASRSSGAARRDAAGPALMLLVPVVSVTLDASERSRRTPRSKPAAAPCGRCSRSPRFSGPSSTNG